MNADTRLVYHINKGQSIISKEIFEHFDLITVGKDGRYQPDALVHGKGRVDQPFPQGRVTRHASLRTDGYQKQ